jgi:hypothetical protein
LLSTSRYTMPFMELKGSLPCSKEPCHWTLSWPGPVESRPSHISLIAKLYCRIPGDVSIRHRSLFGWSIRRSLCFASSASRQCSPGKEMPCSLTPLLWDPLTSLAHMPPFFHCHSHRSFSTSYGHFLAPYSLLISFTTWYINTENAIMCTLLILEFGFIWAVTFNTTASAVVHFMSQFSPH